NPLHRHKIKKHSLNWNAFKIGVQNIYKLLSRVFPAIFVRIILFRSILLLLILVARRILLSGRRSILLLLSRRRCLLLILSRILLNDAFVDRSTCITDIYIDQQASQKEYSSQNNGKSLKKIRSSSCSKHCSHAGSGSREPCKSAAFG